MTARITSDQTKQLNRFVEDAVNRALKNINPDKDGMQRLIERGGEFQAYVVAGIKRFTAKVPNYDLARTILGKDFISPEEVAKFRKGIFYTDEQLARFGDTLPAQDILEWCRDNGMMLVAGPSSAMSLLDIHNLKPDYFYSKKDGWYAEDHQLFSRNDKVESVWIAFRKEPVAGSLSKNWAEQSGLISDPMSVPNAAEAVWCLTMYKAVRGVYLLPNLYVRTSSLDSDSLRVIVGFFDAEGLDVADYWDGSCSGLLGLSAGRKF